MVDLTRGGVLPQAIAGAGTLRLDGSFALGTAPVSIATVQVDAGATLSGVGTVSGAVIDSGSVEAVGGTLTVGGAVSGTGILTTEAGSALDLRTGSTLTETITGAGTLQLDGAFTLGAQPLAVATVLVDPGAKLSGAGTFTGALIDNGSVIAAGGTLTLAGGLSGTGVLGVNTGAVLDLAGPSALAETATGAGGLRIDAAIDFAGSSIKTATTQIDAGGALSGVGTVSSALSVVGTLNAVAGTLSLRGGVLTNLSKTTLSGGTFVVDTNSTLQLADNTTVATDAATIVLNGSASAIQSLDTKTKQELSLRATLATIASGGVLNLLGGGNLHCRRQWRRHCRQRAALAWHRHVRGRQRGARRGRHHRRLWRGAERDHRWRQRNGNRRHTRRLAA